MNRDVEEMHICERGLHVANRLSPVHQSFVNVGLGKAKTVERIDSNNDRSVVLDATLTFHCSSDHHRLFGTLLWSKTETKEQMSHLFVVKRQPGSPLTHVALQMYHHLIPFSHTATELMTSLNDIGVPLHPIPLMEIKKEDEHCILLCFA